MFLTSEKTSGAEKAAEISEEEALEAEVNAEAVIAESEEEAVAETSEIEAE